MTTELERLLEKLEENTRKAKELIADLDRTKSRLALAAPPEEPKPWPGVEGKPDIDSDLFGYYVRQISGKDGWRHIGPTRPTRAEAIAAWNTVVDALTQPAMDTETREAIEHLCVSHSTAEPGCFDVIRVRNWLAAQGETK